MGCNLRFLAATTIQTEQGYATGRSASIAGVGDFVCPAVGIIPKSSIVEADREHNGGKTSRDGLAKPGALLVARTLLRR